MKKLRLIPLLIIVGFIAYAMTLEISSWNPRTIMEIQFKNADSLALGKDKSDLLGDTVEITARVVAPPQVSTPWGMKSLLRGTNSWTCYLQDTGNALWGGIVVRQATRYTNTYIQNVDTGNIIKISGKVQEYFGPNPIGTSGWLTQIDLDTTAPITILSLGGKRPAPKIVKVSEFVTGDYPNGGIINYVEGEKYEGMYVEFRNVETSTGLANRQPFSIIDSAGNKIYIRDFSNFYSTYPSPSSDTLYKLWNWSVPTPGTQLNYIRGVIINANNEGVLWPTLPYVLVPLYPNDISIGQSAPVLSNPSKQPGVPTPSDSVTVNVTVSSVTPLTNVSLLWRINNGAFSTKNFVNTAGNIYSAKIPPYGLNTVVEYFIKATNSAGLSKLLPADTLKSKLFYVVKANDSLSIQEVQFCPNNGGYSGFENAYVRGIEGIVTADTNDYGNFSYISPGGTQTSPPKVYIQNGTGPNSGIWISGATGHLARGQKVRVRGLVEEEYYVTRISVSVLSDVQILSSGNPLPSPQILSTSVLANAKQNGDSTIEKWESVFVRFDTPVTINCINAGLGLLCTTNEPLPDTSFRRNYGEILVHDNSFVPARIELQDGNHTFTNNWDGVTAGKTLLTKNDIISYLQGVFYYSYGSYKMMPRVNSDFGTVTPISVKNTGTVVKSYKLSQNYPNPFNPVTKINFAVPKTAFVSLMVYDILGREVRVLVNQTLNGGEYIFDFDGSDLSTGIYFYRMDATGTDGSNFIEVRKMVLMK